MEQPFTTSLNYIPPHPYHWNHFTPPVDFRVPILDLSANKSSNNVMFPAIMNNKFTLTCPDQKLSTPKASDGTSCENKNTAFNAFSNNSLLLPSGTFNHDKPGGSPGKLIFSDESYANFRNSVQVISEMQTSGQSRQRKREANEKINDSDYWERRRKNNECSKRSRDLRKARCDQILIRCAFLEYENVQLKLQIAALERERSRLQAKAVSLLKK